MDATTGVVDTNDKSTGFHQFILYFDYHKENDGNLLVEITNDIAAGTTAPSNTEAAFAFGDLDLRQCDPGQNYDPINKKCCHKDCDPVSCTGSMIWDCNIVMEDTCSGGVNLATLKQCQVKEVSHSYFGGKHECGAGHVFSKEISVAKWPDKT